MVIIRLVHVGVLTSCHYLFDLYGCVDFLVINCLVYMEVLTSLTLVAWLTWVCWLPCHYLFGSHGCIDFLVIVWLSYMGVLTSCQYFLGLHGSIAFHILSCLVYMGVLTSTGPQQPNPLQTLGFSWHPLPCLPRQHSHGQVGLATQPRWYWTKHWMPPFRTNTTALQIAM